MKKQQTQERGRSNKVMILTCVLVLVAAVIVGAIINNATAGPRFENEIDAINEAFSSKDSTKIDDVLNRTVSSGNYAKVEKSLKAYVRDLIKNIDGINEVAGDEVVYSALEGEYLAKNLDKLDDSIANLEEASKKIEKLEKDAKKLYNEEDVKSYIDSQGLGKEYSDLFYENAKLFYEDDSLRKNYTSTLKLLKSSIAVEIEAVKFLNDHKSDWTIKNGALSFKNDNVENEYIKVLEKVAKI